MTSPSSRLAPLALMVLALSGPASAASLKAAYDPVTASQARGDSLEAANTAFDQALSGAETCPMLVDVTPEAPATIFLRVLAPCLALREVELVYGLKIQLIRLSPQGSFSARLPAVASDHGLTLRLPNGGLIEAPLAFDGAPQANGDALALR